MCEVFFMVYELYWIKIIYSRQIGHAVSNIEVPQTARYHSTFEPIFILYL